MIIYNIYIYIYIYIYICNYICICICMQKKPDIERISPSSHAHFVHTLFVHMHFVHTHFAHTHLAHMHGTLCVHVDTTRSQNVKSLMYVT